MEKSFKEILFEIALKSFPEMVVRAHQIKKECFKIPAEVRVYVKYNEMSVKQQEEIVHNKQSIEMACPVIEHDPYKMIEPYLIALPNGSTRWVDGR